MEFFKLDDAEMLSEVIQENIDNDFLFGITDEEIMIALLNEEN